MIEKMNVKNVEGQQQIKQKKDYKHNLNFRANDYEKTPDSDQVEISNKNKNITTAAIGVGILGTIITLGILGRKGKLGPYIQELLGGTKKGAESIKESLEKLLERFKDKNLNELTNEEKNNIMEALNPENKADIKQKIEAEFETMHDKKVSEVVDSIKQKLKGEGVNSGVNEGVNSGVNSGVKEGANNSPKKPDNKPSEGTSNSSKRENSTTHSSGSGSSAGTHSVISSGSPAGPAGTSHVITPGPTAGPAGTSHVITPGPAARPAGTSHVITPGPAAGPAGTSHVITPGPAARPTGTSAPISEVEDILSAQAQKLDKEIEENMEKIAEQIAMTPNFCDRTPKEITEEFLNRMRAYFETVNPAEMANETRIGAFVMSIKPGMNEAEIKALVEHFKLDEIMQATDETITFNGKTLKAIFKSEDGYILSDGNILAKDGEEQVLRTTEDIFAEYEEDMRKVQSDIIAKRDEMLAEQAARAAEEQAAREAEEKAARAAEEKARREAEEKARRVEEGRQKYAEYSEKLDGVTHFRFNNKKNEELTEMGKYYHDIELAQASELKRQLAAQAEKMKWFDSYLQDEPLRKALGIADDAKIMFSKEFGRIGEPYIKNQKGNIVTYDRSKGIWTEWDAKTIDDVLRDDASKLTQTKNVDGLIITRKRNHDIGGYDYLVRNLETGNETVVRDGRLYKQLPDGNEEEYFILATTKGEVKQNLNNLFAETEATAPKIPPYEGPMNPPESFGTVIVNNGKKQKVLRDIEAYVRSFDEGTFQKVNKTAVFYNAEGEREVVNIVYEGIDFDIDAMGRILPKLKVDPIVRRARETVSGIARRNYNTTTPQRQRVLA